MSVDDFERLVSDWIDQPDQPALEAAIQQAIDHKPGWGALRDQWQRLVSGLRSLPPHGPVPPSLRQGIRAAIEP